MKVSSDPEFPVIDSDGIHRSIIGKIGGSKKEPRAIEYGHVQEDNVLIEMNPIPSDNREGFILNHTNILNEISEILKPLDLSIDISATALFSDDELAHDLAKLAGCEPDFNAWFMCSNSPPDLSATNMRSAGGHLHVSFDEANSYENKRIEVVRSFDIYGTLPSVLLDDNVERRKLYGKAGCYRPKFTTNRDPYDGVELRSLSNFWLKSRELMGWAFDAVELAIKNSDRVVAITEETPKIIDRVISSINRSDRNEARSLCKYLGVPYAT